MKNFIISALAVLFIAFNLSGQVYVASDGNIGIGTSSPSKKLTIDEGSGSSFLKIANGSWGDSYGLTFSSGGTSYCGGKLKIKSSATFNFCLYNYGSGEYRLGIGKENPTCALDVTGTAKVNGSVVLTSDIRAKKNIEGVGIGLSKLSELKPVKYELKNTDLRHLTTLLPTTVDSVLTPKQREQLAKKRIHYGFVAQEIREIFPELVYEDGEGYLSVDYIGLIPILVNSIKEQQDVIAVLEQKMEAIMNDKGL